ncbi:MAG: dipeptide epimerase [Sulfurimonadaceae bacterium]|jgi:L-alanine-DL-glutamate epimerase-like enolase superfamily enzyme|nr:dipeptide epimerase [Sulfurimonadaceae bacterium]
MKIVSIEIQRVKIPLKKAFKTALRVAQDAELIRVFIQTDTLHTGVGEAPATKVITGEGLEEIENWIEKIKKNIYGLTPKEAIEYLHATKIGSSAKAALEMASISLLAQQNNQTLYEYFDIQNTAPLYTAVTISCNSAEEMLEDAKKMFQEKNFILKLKFSHDIEHALDVTHAISKALPKCKILVDPNQAWSVEETLYYLENLKVKIELLEQPVVATDTEGLKRIKEQTDVVIVADEAVFTLLDAIGVMGSKSADMFNIKLMKCGGITKAIELLEYAREIKVGVMLGSMLEGPFSINYALYLAFLYRDVVQFIDLDSPLLHRDMPEALDFMYDGCEIKIVKKEV